MRALAAALIVAGVAAVDERLPVRVTWELREGRRLAVRIDDA